MALHPHPCAPFTHTHSHRKHLSVNGYKNRKSSFITLASRRFIGSESYFYVKKYLNFQDVVKYFITLLYYFVFWQFPLLPKNVFLRSLLLFQHNLLFYNVIEHLLFWLLCFFPTHNGIYFCVLNGHMLCKSALLLKGVKWTIFLFVRVLMGF